MLSLFHLENVLSGREMRSISHLEHHANIVPWQMMCNRKQASLKVIPVNDDGMIIYEDSSCLLKTRLLAVTQASNALGIMLPVEKMIHDAHTMNIPVLVDGAQGIQHGATDVRKMDCDFYVFQDIIIRALEQVCFMEKWTCLQNFLHIRRR